MPPQVKKIHPVWVLALLTIAATILSVVLLILGLRERELEHAKLEMKSLTEMLMEQTEQNFDSVDLTLKGIQERLGTAFGRQFELDSLPIHLLLSSRASGTRQLRAIFIVDPQGVVINSSTEFPSKRASVADRNYYRALLQDHSNTLFIDKPVRSRSDNRWTLHLSRALLDGDGKLIGVVVAVMGIEQLEQQYTIIKLDYSRPIGIYMTDGTLVASLPHQDDMIGEKAPELTNERLPTKTKEIVSIHHTSGDGGQVKLSIGRLEDYPILLSVTEDGDLALASWRETAVPIAIGGVLVSLFTVFVAVFLIGKLKSRALLAHALKDATGLYQQTVDSVMDAIVAIDEAQHIVLLNPAAEKMFGYTASELMGQHFERLMPERARNLHEEHINRFADSDESSRTMAPQMEITGLRSNGEEFPIESTISRSMVGGRLQMTAVLRDVTDRRRAQRELQQVNKQLRQLTSSLQSVREQERKRLSSELHDDLGQQLTGLKLSLSWLTNRLRDGRAATLDMVDDMRGLVDTAIGSVRRISSELRPLILEDLGFEEAIAWHCQDFEKRSKIKVILNVSGTQDITGDDLITALFRIVQESLTNVVKHAQATQVNIDVVALKNELVLTVADNGQGLAYPLREGGIGLVSMRERAISIGAIFKVSSSPGQGTMIELIIPMGVSTTTGVAV
ncbi:PAS domain S-box protein [Rhodoferax sp.]|uniref:PAS domain S-box protein n=1 Tax=Rhodoferax sp. TaxID=50421 RepID=UPI0028494300|nr:PAS domain S-box protein [Rhodoferax sp.]MDR3368972.1 PAS domain S-box protein [Rhodoferax sp.]